MSIIIRDGDGHVKGEATTGNTPKYYENGYLVGEIKDNGTVVNEYGTKIDDLGPNWRG